MSFDLYDFEESIRIAGIPVTRLEHCSLAFGESPEGFGSWHGGFVCHTRSGKPWVFVFGWCDTTGWGCQDGAYVHEFDHEPTHDELVAAWGGDMYVLLTEIHADDFDESPADLNRYLVGKIDKWGRPTTETSS